jgi:hypothetical protein
MLDDPAIARGGLWTLHIPCLLGDQELLREAGQRLLENEQHVVVRDESPSVAVDFLIGKMPQNEYLLLRQKTEMARVAYNFNVAMRFLAEGKRDEALNYFDECASSSQLGSAYRIWAKAYRRLLTPDR